MGIKAAEERLLVEAKRYSATGQAASLLVAAIEYGKAKIKGWRNRDRWKTNKRLGANGQG